MTERRILPGPHADTSLPKARGRPFAPGNRLNPGGRPKGSRHKAYTALEAIGTDAAGEILKEVIQQALAGDMQAARIILDRVWPAPKGRLLKIALPPVETVTDLGGAHDVIRGELAAARITLDEAATLFAIIESRRRLIETTELERRVEELEQGRSP